MTTNAYAGVGHFGPGVLGQAEWEKEQAILKSGANKYGPGVIGSPLGTPVNEVAPEAPKKGKK